MRRSLIFATTVAALLSACSGVSDIASGECEDVTSMDENWQNDMRCKTTDGTEFYTDYEGAEEFEETGVEPDTEDEVSEDEDVSESDEWSGDADDDLTDDLVEESEEPSPEVQSQQRTTCIDVTSYDYNWNNDMKCTRPDGSVFYTDYEGARSAEAGE